MGKFTVKMLEHVRLHLCFDTLRHNLQAEAMGEHLKAMLAAIERAEAMP